MSATIDQSDDSEFAGHGGPVVPALYIAIMGGAPQEDEDCTVEQLSALNKRVASLDLPPYVDLAVWQPYGRRALKATKFRAWFPDGAGAYIAKELPGPSNYSQWLAAWRVFQTAAIMLDILPLATLQLYEQHIERLTKLYPAAWHLVALANDKARGEKWARFRLKITADNAAGKPKPDRWDERRPWIAAMHAIVNDSAYWEEQVRAPANAWMATGGRGVPKTPEDDYNHSRGSAAGLEDEGSPNKRRTAKERRQESQGECRQGGAQEIAGDGGGFFFQQGHQGRQQGPGRFEGEGPGGHGPLFQLGFGERALCGLRPGRGLQGQG